jgi:ABC-type branched-subunit amino acid transport system substrate-binding protein
MHAAHERHVIHRDLKPANVLFAADGTPKVADFGLARRLDEAGGTQTGHIIGSPPYMAPEQAAGLGNKAGPRTDVYALGTFLYECLTGRPPFKGATNLDTLQQVLDEEPLEPRKLNPKVPPDLETICLKCLRKDPAARYGTAEDLAEDLSRFLDDKPVSARRRGWTERALEWCRRRPAAAMLTCLSMIVAGGPLLLLLVYVITVCLYGAGSRPPSSDGADDTRPYSFAGSQGSPIAVGDKRPPKVAALAGKEIVVGMSAAFTGPSRALGIELYRGSRAWLDEANEKGGVRGWKVVLRAYDDGCNPTPAIENTVRLIERDDVLVLFDYVGTPTVNRVLPLLKRHSGKDIFLFCPLTGAESVRRPPYEELVFNLRASERDETAGLVDHFVAIGRKKVGVFFEIDAYGRGGWDGVREELAAHGLRMVSQAAYRRGARFLESMRLQVNILRDSGADAVVCVGAYAACAAFVRDARDAGWDVPIANVSFVGSESLLALLQQTGDAFGKDYTHDLINSQVVPSPCRPDLPGVEEYRRLMDKHNPAPPDQADGEREYQPLPYSFVGLEGFLNARLLTAVLAKVGPDFSRDRIRQAGESLNEFDLGVGATASLGPDRHQALTTVYFTTAEGGQFVRLPDEGWKKWQH